MLSKLLECAVVCSPVLLVAASSDVKTALAASLCFAVCAAGCIGISAISRRLDIAAGVRVLCLVCAAFTLACAFEILGSTFIPKLFALGAPSVEITLACAFTSFCIAEYSAKEKAGAAESLLGICPVAVLLLLLSFVREVLSGSMLGMNILPRTLSGLSLAQKTAGGLIFCAILIAVVRCCGATFSRGDNVRNDAKGVKGN